MKSLAAFIIVLSLANICNAQLKKFTVEVPVRPKIAISDSIQSVTILNRSISQEFTNYNNDSLQNSFFRKNFKVDALILDSIAADTTIKVLADLLYSSQRFDVVIPKYCTMERTAPYSQKMEPISWDIVSEICDTFKTDALIVLEDFLVYAVTNYSITRLAYSDQYGNNKVHNATIDSYSRLHWRIYYPKSKKIILDIDKNQDTLYWSSSETSLIKTFEKLPSIKVAAIETGIYAAGSFSKLISPNWKEVSRFYYVLNNSQIDQSVTLAANGDWKGALQNWLAFANDGKSTQKSKIMMNIALACEMTGDLDGAIEWAKKSIKTYYREVANYYLKELIIRKKTQQI